MRKLLGYGVFFSAMWDKENWQFGEVAGVQPTCQVASDLFNRRTTHCLHRETRPIYSTTRLNCRSWNKPSKDAWVLASDWLAKHPN